MSWKKYVIVLTVFFLLGGTSELMALDFELGIGAGSTTELKGEITETNESMTQSLTSSQYKAKFALDSGLIFGIEGNGMGYTQTKGLFSGNYEKISISLLNSFYMMGWSFGDKIQFQAEAGIGTTLALLSQSTTPNGEPTVTRSIADRFNSLVAGVGIDRGGYGHGVTGSVRYLLIKSEDAFGMGSLDASGWIFGVVYRYRW